MFIGLDYVYVHSNCHSYLDFHMASRMSICSCMPTKLSNLDRTQK